MNKILLISTSLFTYIMLGAVSDQLISNKRNLSFQDFRMAQEFEYRKKDIFQALKYYESSCDLKNALACLWGGMMLRDHNIMSTKSRKLISKSCSLGNSYACNLQIENSIFIAKNSKSKAYRM